MDLNKSHEHKDQDHEVEWEIQYTKRGDDAGGDTCHVLSCGMIYSNAMEYNMWHTQGIWYNHTKTLFPIYSIYITIPPHLRNRASIAE